MAEYKEFFREGLLNGYYGIYRVILDEYREPLEFLQTPSFFRRWLAEELDVPIETINLSSLNSALQRQRKKHAQKIKLPATQKGPYRDLLIFDEEQNN